ncbi:apolipoprotein C-II [Chaetodon auriga]|uniref:apolipoprotein C-II n=1 Tax=Chaetodon auriga TaxID=39042 RepID=UPI004032974E
MNKLLVITVLVALFALSAESFRVPRQAEEEQEEQGTLTKISNTVKSYYDSAVNTVSDCLDSVKGMKLEEKAANLYTDTVTVVSTYVGIFNDQLYHYVYPE